LLAAATHTADAFEEHAIRHALMTLNDWSLLTASLEPDDPGIRRAAQRVIERMATR